MKKTLRAEVVKLFTSATKQMNELKPFSVLLLVPFLLAGCGSAYNPSIETEEAMPQLIDDGNTEFN